MQPHLEGLVLVEDALQVDVDVVCRVPLVPVECEPEHAVASVPVVSPPVFVVVVLLLPFFLCVHDFDCGSCGAFVVAGI